MALKTLQEIAFDAFQQTVKLAGDHNRMYTSDWEHLTQEERVVFECIANRVYAEVLMRQNPDQQTIAMPLSSKSNCHASFIKPR
jgi:hypothetical protein